MEVRSQGAQVSGAQAGPITIINVDSPGAVVATNTVSIGTAGTTRTVSSVTASTVVVGGPGFASVSDDDRITIVSPLPTLYEDAEAATSKTNALTTDAAGYANCYIVGGKYDILISGGGLTTTLRIDVPAVGGESCISTIFSGTAWKLDTLRSLAATDKLLDVQTAGVSKFSVAGDGEVVAGAAGATHNLTGTITVSSNASVGGTLSVTGNVITDMTVQDKVINLTDSTPTTRLTLDGSSGGSPLISAIDQLLTIKTSLAQGSKTSGAIQLTNTTDLNASDNAVAVLIGASIVFAIGNTNYRLYINGTGASHGEIMAGTGTPEAAVTAPVGSIYLRSNGGAATTLYVKESGAGNVGWVGK